VPLFTSGGLGLGLVSSGFGLGLVILVLVLVLRIWSCLHDRHVKTDPHVS